jgi:hypothetical protein
MGNMIAEDTSEKHYHILYMSYHQINLYFISLDASFSAWAMHMAIVMQERKYFGVGRSQTCSLE